MPRTATAPPPTIHPPAPPRPDDLASRLLDFIALVRARRAPTRDPTGRTVLFDLEVNGVRCVIYDADPPDPERPLLSPREQEIVRMVAKGYGNKTIARVLDISCWTVGTYLRRIFAKLNVGTRAAMIAKTQSYMLTPNGSK